MFADELDEFATVFAEIRLAVDARNELVIDDSRLRGCCTALAPR